MIGVIADTDPFSLFSASGRELLLLAILVPLAIFVFWFGRRAASRRRGEYGLRPSGRIFRGRAQRSNDAWRAEVARLEALPPTPIAEAKRASVRFEGTLTAASGNLGGPPGRECVWRNRAGARPESAVGAEVVIVADASGRAGIEGIEGATVIAPSDHHSLHHENVSLYLGDRVEVLGYFEPESTPPEPTRADQSDPSVLVYGTVGGQGSLQLRLIERRPAPQPTLEPAP